MAALDLLSFSHYVHEKCPQIGVLLFYITTCNITDIVGLLLLGVTAMNGRFRTTLEVIRHRGNMSPVYKTAALSQEAALKWRSA